MYTVKLNKQALQDIEKVMQVDLLEKVKCLINILIINPHENAPPYQNLYGDLKEFYSRRINWQHQLVYSVHEDEKTVVIRSMWTHYE